MTTTTYNPQDRVVLKNHPSRGVGTVVDTGCGWPRCQNAECVAVRWDTYFPSTTTNHEATDLGSA